MKKVLLITFLGCTQVAFSQWNFGLSSSYLGYGNTGTARHLGFTGGMYSANVRAGFTYKNHINAEFQLDHMFKGTSYNEQYSTSGGLHQESISINISYLGDSLTPAKFYPLAGCKIAYAQREVNTPPPYDYTQVEELFSFGFHAGAGLRIQLSEHLFPFFEARYVFSRFNQHDLYEIPNHPEFTLGIRTQFRETRPYSGKKRPKPHYSLALGSQFHYDRYQYQEENKSAAIDLQLRGSFWIGERTEMLFGLNSAPEEIHNYPQYEYRGAIKRSSVELNFLYHRHPLKRFQFYPFAGLRLNTELSTSFSKDYWWNGSIYYNVYLSDRIFFTGLNLGGGIQYRFGNTLAYLEARLAPGESFLLYPELSAGLKCEFGRK